MAINNGYPPAERASQETHPLRGRGRAPPPPLQLSSLEMEVIRRAGREENATLPGRRTSRHTRTGSAGSAREPER
jgi:hypothetical protein